MYSFYGGQKGQDFKINRIFSNRAEDMVNDLKARWMSPVNVGDYIFISYGDPSRMNEEDSIYNTNLQKDLQDSGKSYTNSLWQKIYVDNNLKISPDFPASDNNVYIFLNLDNEATEIGTSLKEISDIESEECFGFGYRLIACVTGTTPRIQVFHSVINIEDGDPYVTLDLTNPDTPKIKFYLQREQKVEEIWTNVISSQENPSVDMVIDGREYESKINGQTKKATLTTPRLDFNLPKAPSFFVGELFGLGPINFYHHIAYQNPTEEDYSQYNYEVTQQKVQIISSLATLIRTLMFADEIQENDKNHLFDPSTTGGFYPQGALNTDYHLHPFIIENNQVQIYSKVKDAINDSYKNFIKTGLIAKEDGSWTWRENKDQGTGQNLIYLLREMMPRSFYDLAQVGYDLFDICDKIINWTSEDGEFTYIFDTQGLIYYVSDTLLKLQTLSQHYENVIDNGYIGDFYISEPSGKIYQIYYLDKKNKTCLRAMYLGCLTAPEPIATSYTISPFKTITDKQGNISYTKNLPEVKSTLIDRLSQNTGYYQEGFNFYLPETTDTDFVTKNVSNDKDFNISEIKPISETTQQMTIETPMPIHILTDKQVGLKLKIDDNDNIEMSYDKATYNGPILGPGDLFFNMPTTNDAQGRGYVIKYKGAIAPSLAEQNPMPADWELVGKISGTPGIPIAKIVINVALDTSITDTSIHYIGKNSDNSYGYKAKTDENGQTTGAIASKILNGQNIINNNPEETLPIFNINPLNGEMVMINFYNDDELIASYWGILVNNVWNLVAFSGNSSSIIKSEKVTENERSTAYSVWYMDNNYIDSQMDKINQKIKITWNEWV